MERFKGKESICDAMAVQCGRVMCEWSLAAVRAGIDCRTRASIGSGDAVSRVKRQARDLAGTKCFSLALRTSCIRSLLVYQNLKRFGLAFLRAMAICRLDRLGREKAC